MPATIAARGRKKNMRANIGTCGPQKCKKFPTKNAFFGASAADTHIPSAIHAIATCRSMLEENDFMLLWRPTKVCVAAIVHLYSSHLEGA